MPDYYERTKYEAQLDIKYARCFHSLNERFYCRLDFIFGLITLIGGSAIAASTLGQYEIIYGWLGGMVAISTLVEFLVKAPEKKCAHRDMRAKFADLDARSGSMSLEQIDAELLQLQDNSSGIKGLEAVAYNQNLKSNGREDASVLKLNIWNNFLSLLA